jgi:hypothetical protein
MEKFVKSKRGGSMSKADKQTKKSIQPSGAGPMAEYPRESAKRATMQDAAFPGGDQPMKLPKCRSSAY